jgi:hypothetical protein
MKIFDPLTSRSCRNIRNEMAVGLLRAIHDRNLAPVLAIAETYRAMGLEPHIQNYIEARMSRYRKILSQIPPEDPTIRQALSVAVLLWDHKLFFEVHEWLEKKWHRSRGAEKALYQALIRAAGTYMHLESNRTETARKIAAKAIPVLKKHRALLPADYPLGALISGLESLDPDAPKLGGDSPFPSPPPERGRP